MYYFMEQAVWLSKAGALGKEHENQLASASAWAEMVGYLGSITISFIKLKEIVHKEEAIQADMEKRRKASCSYSCL